MFKKLVSLLCILVLLFSLTACNSADDEDSAMAGEIVQDNNDDADNNDGSSSDNQSGNQNDSQSGSQSDNNDKTPSDSTSESEPKPDLSTKGDFSITFNYDYDGKIETEKTDGKVTEIKPTRKGYNFVGWYNGNNKFDFSKSVSSDTSLTAKWEVITYKITYDANGGQLPEGNPVTYTVEDSIDFKPATKKGKAFLGWGYVTDGGGESITNGFSKGTTGDYHLIAKWDETVIVLGTYEQDNDMSNGAEPIEWIKLKEENGKAMLISKYILDARPYQSPKKDTNWSISSIRTWLNGAFYKTAFSADDKPYVLKEKISTPANSQTGVGVNVTSEDYVTLLSLDEAEELTTWQQRKVKVTAFAKAQGCTASGEGTGDWWLRTVGCYQNYGAIVQQNSGIRENGYSADMTTIGVRPVIWVDLSKLS